MGKIARPKACQTWATSESLPPASYARYHLTAMRERHGSMPIDDCGCGLYVHIPFCQAKCGYCDFYSVAVETGDTAALLDRLGRELRRRSAESPYKICTVFYGGGTPTILPTGQLAALFEVQAEVLPPGEIKEFTVEANPATVDGEKAAVLAEAGVTRVSIGAQSFLPDELSRLERLHSPDDIEPSVRVLRQQGPLQVNLDCG